MKSKIRNVIIHNSALNRTGLEMRVDKYYADVIERRVNESRLSREEKRELIDRLIEAYKK